MPFTRRWALFPPLDCQSDGRLSRRDLDRRGNGTTGNNISWNEIGKPGPAATKLAFKKSLYRAGCAGVLVSKRKTFVLFGKNREHRRLFGARHGIRETEFSGDSAAPDLFLVHQKFRCRAALVARAIP